MSKTLEFIPVRISESDGIKLFIKQLQLYDEEIKCVDNIEKRLLYFCCQKFSLQYTEYKKPTNFTIVSFTFYDDVYFQEFINSNYYHIKGLINVSNNPLFEEDNINNYSVCPNRFIVEGVKGVGKSSLIKCAVSQGIICQDRDMLYISNNYYDNLPIEKKALDFYNYIHKDDNLYCLFLMNNDCDSLLKRINHRDMMNQKDIISERYRDFSKLKEYVDRYSLLEKYMKENGLIDSKVDFVDCLADGVEKQNKKLLKIMKNK